MSLEMIEFENKQEYSIAREWLSEAGEDWEVELSGNNVHSGGCIYTAADAHLAEHIRIMISVSRG